jgi:hypothetical protein
MMIFLPVVSSLVFGLLVMVSSFRHFVDIWGFSKAEAPVYLVC